MISAYCIDTVTIIKHGGYDSWQEPLASVNIDVKGKIEHKIRMVRNLAGEEVISSIIVTLPETIESRPNLNRALTHEDKLKFNDVEYTIIRIDKPKAFSNPIYEVYLE